MNPAYRTARFRCEPPPDGIPRRFGIITAFNPGDVLVSEEANREADLRLAEELDIRGIRRFRVTGGSPDFSHAEPGWGAESGSLEDSVLLGRMFGQAAVFWVHDDVLTLVDCRTGDSEILGAWSERVTCVP